MSLLHNADFVPEMLALASQFRACGEQNDGGPGFVTSGYSGQLVIATFVRANPRFIIILDAFCCRRSQSTLGWELIIFGDTSLPC